MSEGKKNFLQKALIASGQINGFVLPEPESIIRYHPLYVPIVVWNYETGGAEKIRNAFADPLDAEAFGLTVQGWKSDVESSASKELGGGASVGAPTIGSVKLAAKYEASVSMTVTFPNGIKRFEPDSLEKWKLEVMKANIPWQSLLKEHRQQTWWGRDKAAVMVVSGIYCTSSIKLTFHVSSGMEAEAAAAAQGLEVGGHLKKSSSDGASVTISSDNPFVIGLALRKVNFKKEGIFFSATQCKGSDDEEQEFELGEEEMFLEKDVQNSNN